MLFVNYEPIKIMEESLIDMVNLETLDENNLNLVDDDKKVKVNFTSEKTKSGHRMRLKLEQRGLPNIVYIVDENSGKISTNHESFSKNKVEANKYLKLFESFTKYSIDVMKRTYETGDFTEIKKAEAAFNKLTKAQRRKAYNGELKYGKND